MENNSNLYDLAIIGNYTKDTIVSASGTRYVDGGGFNYGAYVAAMMGLKVATITQLAKEDFHVVDALAELGVEVLAYETPKSTHMRLYYPGSNVDERVLSVTQTAGEFTPSQVQSVHAKAFLINASTRGEVNLCVIKELRKKDAMIVADVQGFLRVISPDGTLKNEPWPEKQEVLSFIDILKTDAMEAKMLTGESNIKVSARLLADFGPGEIVLTHRDGLLVYADGRFYEAAFHPEKLVGRSGRGDTCIGAYAAKRLTALPEDATIWAAAVTSLKMEEEGPIRRTISEVEELVRQKYKSQHSLDSMTCSKFGGAL
ncbi:MAG: PfkB family carbohydrate kinase [bacterium]